MPACSLERRRAAFFYIYVSLVCSCVQIQRDALSTKGVKINVLFTFILTVTQQASEEFPVLPFLAFLAPDRIQSVQIMEWRYSSIAT